MSPVIVHWKAENKKGPRDRIKKQTILLWSKSGYFAGWLVGVLEVVWLLGVWGGAGTRGFLRGSLIELPTDLTSLKDAVALLNSGASLDRASKETCDLSDI